MPSHRGWSESHAALALPQSEHIILDENKVISAHTNVYSGLLTVVLSQLLLLPGSSFPLFVSLYLVGH